jgi:O-acetyl-ADP-ribose deacetylase
MSGSLRVILGDITQLNVDAIVTAANISLSGGMGVDAAIHRAAGSQLMEECRQLKECPVGQVRATHGYRLPVRAILHTVGPTWQGGRFQEDGLLNSCYEKCLNIAYREGFRSIAFPCISTGVSRFPKARAAAIAINSCWHRVTEDPHPLQVVFCCFAQEDVDLYQVELRKLMPKILCASR